MGRKGRIGAFKGVPSSTMPCGKVGYLTRPEARAAARRLAHRIGKQARVYRCPDGRCEGLPWHLTSLDARGTAGLRAQIALADTIPSSTEEAGRASS